MTLSPRGRTAWLVAHVATSVGFLGAVAGFLALALVGLFAVEPDLIRAVDVACSPRGS